MYIKVDSVALLNHFNQIWMECWLEKGYFLENENSLTDRYIITDIEERKVGTIEFKPYSLDPKNNINTVFPFHELESIVKETDSVIEIDKVAILKEFRGKNLDRLLSLFVHYTEDHDINYCVVLLERIFYKALKNVYKIPLEAVGEKIYYKGDYVIPAIVCPKEIYQNKKDYKWIVSINQNKKRKLILI
ncbi:hypothetical protein [Pseudoneobacillus rhizosphaerae]|uniref:Uncharacterized protein n=1 Tax=Pseudoneobacillus rhizosphaerae TaxID=2880968 RepID=A0A9C7G8M0_9BACI|nr:hypothetical protein [Pseudoneobacillus rhizosphaerae]CAG9607781.1 hypothetical protein NEOCIP111885_01473 [Pseudoneobacillus rhizosphaerae]